MTQHISVLISQLELETLIDQKTELAVAKSMENFNSQPVNFSKEEAAIYLCIPKGTLSQLNNRSKINYSKIGKRCVYRKEVLDNFLISNEKKTAAQIINDAG